MSSSDLQHYPPGLEPKLEPKKETILKDEYKCPNKCNYKANLSKFDEKQWRLVKQYVLTKGVWALDKSFILIMAKELLSLANIPEPTCVADLSIGKGER